MNVSIATRKLLHNCHAPVSRNTFDMEKVEKNFSRDLPGINLAYFYHSADGGGRGEGGGSNEVKMAFASVLLWHATNRENTLGLARR